MKEIGYEKIITKRYNDITIACISAIFWIQTHHW